MYQGSLVPDNYLGAQREKKGKEKNPHYVITLSEMTTTVTRPLYLSLQENVDNNVYELYACPHAHRLGPAVPATRHQLAIDLTAWQNGI